MATLKAVMREVRDDAAALLNKDADSTKDNNTAAVAIEREKALLAIALAALRRLQDCPASCAAEAKRARKALKPYLVVLHNEESNEQDEAANHAKRAREEDTREGEGQVNLGQYAHSRAFADDARRQERFARLMGGARGAAGKETAPSHNTHAADARSMAEINRQLVAQYDAARTHKGKKGLGA